MRLRSHLLLPVLAAACLAALLAPGAAGAQTAQPRIISGSDVPITAYPFQVRLRIQTAQGTFLCGGAIRDETHVLTAAHCATTQVSSGTPHVAVLPAQLTVYYGSASTSTQLSKSVSAVAVPSQYTAATGADESYDVALLTLSSPIDLSGPNAKRIPLARPEQPKDAGNAFVTGFGRTSPTGGSTSSTLKGVSVPLRLDSACQSVFGSYYRPARSVCAGGGSQASSNPDSCNGDSGGPLAVDLDTTSSATDYVLLGLVSYGESECGKQNSPAVYTWVQGSGVSTFLDAPTYQSARATSGNFEAPPTYSTPTSPSPAPTAPPAGPAARDIVRPVARLSSLRCRHHRCTLAFKARDAGGSVRRLSATVSRRVRVCRHGWCKTVTKKKKLTVKRTSTGFSVRTTLTPALYRLDAVATDAAGNRSKKVSKRFRVKR